MSQCGKALSAVKPQQCGKALSAVKSLSERLRLIITQRAVLLTLRAVLLSLRAVLFMFGNVYRCFTACSCGLPRVHSRKFYIFFIQKSIKRA